MRKLLAFIAVLLVAGSASAITEIGKWEPQSGGAEIWEYLDSTDVSGTYLLGKRALRSSTINFELGSAFVGTLYACDTQAYVAATCDTVTALSADVSNLEYTTARRYFILVITTPEDTNFVSTLSIKGSLVVSRGGGARGYPDRIVLYGDSLTDDSTSNKGVCDWCADTIAAGVTVYNAAANGARNHTNGETNCDSGVYTSCIHGERQILSHPTLGACSRGTTSTPRDMYGDTANDLTCINDLGFSLDDGAVYYFGVNMVTQGSVAGWDSTYEALSRNAARDQLDEIYWGNAVGCTVVLGPPFWEDSEYVDRDQNLVDFHDWMKREVPVAYPRCELVDIHTALEDYESANGTTAALGLYASCDAKGSTTGDCTHMGTSSNALGDNGRDWTGSLILPGIKKAHENQYAGFTRSVDKFQHLFRHNPLLRSWQDQQGSTYDSANAMVTGHTVSTPAIVTLNDVQLTSSDMSCMLRLNAAAASSDWHGCLFRLKNRDFAGSSYIRAYASGSGLVEVDEMSGSSVVNNVSSGQDAGNLGPDDCAGFQISGIGDSTIVKVWLADCSVFSGNENDVSQWGTCSMGFYDASSAPGCAVGDVSVDFASSGFNSGRYVGVYHRDDVAEGVDGIEEVWFSNP